jgi:TPR repeat protein
MMAAIPYFFATLVMLASTPVIAADEPRFEDFQVREIYKGRTHFPDFKGVEREFAHFRTRISNGLKEGPNFAGRYSIIEVRCGTGCRNVYIADNPTGKVFHFPRGGEDNYMLVLEFRVDSRLVIAQWSSYEKDECVVEFFEWDGSQATVIGKKTLGKKEACWRTEVPPSALPSYLEELTAKATEYRLAAEQGEAPAQFLLGDIYEEGKGVPQDYVEAAKWYRRAAEQGYAAAQLLLGTLYAQGKGVPQSDAEATQWYRLASEQGDDEAQFKIGVAYDLGRGVPKDDAEAAKWYRFAAEQGKADAQYLLGTMYISGEGVPQDYVLAHTWLNLAASRLEGKKREAAANSRNLLEELMTPEQIAEAQRLAREWKPKSAAPAP